MEVEQGVNNSSPWQTNLLRNAFELEGSREHSNDPSGSIKDGEFLV
jgi:hypothetical protein